MHATGRSGTEVGAGWLYLYCRLNGVLSEIHIVGYTHAAQQPLLWLRGIEPPKADSGASLPDGVFLSHRVPLCAGQLDIAQCPDAACRAVVVWRAKARLFVVWCAWLSREGVNSGPPDGTTENEAQDPGWHALRQLVQHPV